MAAQDTGVAAADAGSGTRDVFPATALVVAGHLALVAVRPSPTPAELAAVELATLAVLATLALAFPHERRLRGLVTLVAFFFAFVGGTWLLLGWLAPLQVALTLVTAATLCSYGLHRYQLVALDTVEGRDEQ
jgi:hypothetical protein